MSKELNKAPVEQAGGDEREEFELFVRKHCGMPEHIAVNWDAKFTNDAWEGWQARAALAQPSPAQTQPSPAPTLRAAIDVANDRFEVPVAKWGTDLVGEEERPEVAEVAFVLRNIGAMDAEDIDGDNVDLRFEDAEGRDTGCDVSIVEYAEKAADLFEQHDRIVGELRAVIAQLRQHKNDYMDSGQETYRALQNEIREREAEIARLDGLVSGRTAERDAALARVAELERQEPVALANRGLHAFWVKWTEAAAGLYGPGIKLYAAPVAQAQHSVPAYVSYTTRPAESLAGIALRQLKDESRWVEIRDINAHAFPDMQSHSYYPAGTVIKLPAAAPGKEEV
ncbi:LysM peptidoglycan-binding domain-containing protein [Pseudomonas aeruginosa]